MPTAKVINSDGREVPDEWEGSITVEDNVTADNFLGAYKTIWIPTSRMYLPSTDPADALGATEEGTNDVMYQYYAFDFESAEEKVCFTLVIPANWDRGSIKAKFYWSSDTGTTEDDTVQWGIQARSYKDSQDKDSAWGTAQVITDTLLADDGADLQVTSATPAIAVGSPSVEDDLTQFRVYRDIDGTDNMGDYAWLFGVLIQYYENDAETGW